MNAGCSSFSGRSAPARFQRGQDGFALIITLWVMGILGVMASTFAFQAECETKVEHWSTQSRRAYNLARAGVHRTAGLIREHARDSYHSITASWFSGAEEYRNVSFGPGYYSIVRQDIEPKDGEAETAALSPLKKDEGGGYGLMDEESLLNINTATMTQLQGFPNVSNVLAANIILFITQKKEALKKEKNQQGQQNHDTSAQQDGLVDGPLREVKELLQVKGMTKEIFYGSPGEQGGLADCLTCFSSGKVNINTAKPAVLHAIGFTKQQVQALMDFRMAGWKGFSSVDAAMKAVATGEPGDAAKPSGADLGSSTPSSSSGAASFDSPAATPKPSAPSSAAPAGSGPADLSNLLTVTSKNFRMTCLAGFDKGKPVHRITARLTLTGNALRFTMWRSDALDEVSPDKRSQPAATTGSGAV
jgi:general secretion pathway protein K